MKPLLVLDLDDTIYPERQYVLSGFAAVDRWLKDHLGIAGFEEDARTAFSNGIRGNTFDLVLTNMGVPLTPDIIAQLVDVYRSHTPRISMYSDAAWCLSRLGDAFDFGLLTDGYLASQRIKVQALGIAHRFRTIVYSDELGRDCWKPSPVPYLEMMRRCGQTGSTCIYVGDNPSKDFVSPNQLGWLTIRIRRAGSIHEHTAPEAGHDAHGEIESLYELYGAIELLRPATVHGPGRTNAELPLGLCIPGSRS